MFSNITYDNNSVIIVWTWTDNHRTERSRVHQAYALSCDGVAHRERPKIADFQAQNSRIRDLLVSFYINCSQRRIPLRRGE